MEVARDDDLLLHPVAAGRSVPHRVGRLGQIGDRKSVDVGELLGERFVLNVDPVITSHEHLVLAQIGHSVWEPEHNPFRDPLQLENDRASDRAGDTDDKLGSELACNPKDWLLPPLVY